MLTRSQLICVRSFHSTCQLLPRQSKKRGAASSCTKPRERAVLVRKSWPKSSSIVFGTSRRQWLASQVGIHLFRTRTNGNTCPAESELQEPFAAPSQPNHY